MASKTLLLKGHCGVAMHWARHNAEVPEAGRVTMRGCTQMRSEVARLA